jgi:hypothetical protein
MIVAMIALFVAMTGTAVATSSALIGGAQIRNNSITGADIKNKSLRPIDFRGSVRGVRGLRGLAGPPGPAGAAGAQGAQGAQGPPGPDNIRLAAQQDSTPGGTSVTGITSATPVQLNSLTFTAPSNGYIVISGMVFINSTTATVYYLTPRIDGTNVRTFGILDGAAAGELESMAYTMTAPITAGAHTISQTVRPESGTANFFYNANDLTVTFIPQGSVVPAALAATSAAASG